MKTNDLDVLRRVDPAAGVPDGPQAERLRAGLQRVRTRIAAEQHVAPINATGVAGQPKRPVRRRVVLAATAAAVMVAGAGLVVADPFGSTGVAVAATPPVLDHELAQGRPAKADLLVLAARAARSTTLPGDSAGVHSVRTRSWYLSTTVDGKRVTSAVVPEETTLKWNSDLSGEMRVTTGQPYFPGAEYRKAWTREGAPGMPGKVLREQSWSTGSYTTAFHYPLPSDPGQLFSALKVGHPVDVDGTGQLTSAVADLYRETVPSPAVRAAVLKVLAGRSDIVALGPITDRVGRTGQGFAIDTTYTGLPRRHVLIFDVAAGALLADEELLTKTAGALRVRVPSVIGYTVYL